MDGTRVAVAPAGTERHTVLKPDLTSNSGPAREPETPIARAIRTITECQTRYKSVRDYECTFYKRERVRGKLTPQHVMLMKARTTPRSIYFKFDQPFRGREAIYVEGRHDGKVIAHEVGVLGFLAGRLELDPTGARAMEDCRHPITEAGVGALIETISGRWLNELDPGESVMSFEDEHMVGERRCRMVQAVHPRPSPEFMFHKVRLFIDQELGLPIRFEAFDWPRKAGEDPELMEEYCYLNLRLNVGLHDVDFDPANRQYAFSRF